MAQTVQCLNPQAHGVRTHVAGSAAALACVQTGGASTKIGAISHPPRQVHKGNNIGTVGVMTNISEEAMDWGKQNLTRESPKNVAAILEVMSSSSSIQASFYADARPFIAMMHDDDYKDEYGDTPLLPDPYELGAGWEEPNDLTKQITGRAPNGEFMEAVAHEAGLSSEDAREAYGVIQGYLSNEDKAKVYAVATLRARVLDLEDEKKVIESGISALKDIFNKQVDDGTKTETHGIPFRDGKGVQFTPKRVFDYEKANPVGKVGEEAEDALTQAEYASLIKQMNPAYKPLAEIEKILGDKADAFIEFGTTALTVK